MDCPEDLLPGSWISSLHCTVLYLIFLGLLFLLDATLTGDTLDAPGLPGFDDDTMVKDSR
mgnify:CR=1 FL=1